MREFDLFLKEMNLIFTGTSKEKEIYDNDVIETTKVNYDNTINLYNLFKSYNELYLLFQEEYGKMNKINFGNDTKFINFIKFEHKGELHRILTFEILEPKNGNYEKGCYLHLLQNGNQFTSNITNGVYAESKKDVTKDVMDEVEIKKYLDLFEKYHMLFKLQERFNREKIVGDGCCMLYATILGNILDGNNRVDILMGSFYMNTSYSVKLVINLGENFGLNKEKCEIILDNEKVNHTDENLYKSFNGVYLSKKNLCEKEDNNHTFEKVKIKIVNY